MLDENNKVSLVESNNDIEEILNLENDLEIERKNLNENNEKLNNLQNSYNKINILLIASMILGLVLTFLVSYYLTGIMILLYLAISCGIIFGTNELLNKEEYKLVMDKEVILTNIEILEDKLNKLKTKSNYKVEKLTDCIENNYSYQEKTLTNLNNVKKLTLKKDK